MTEAPSSDVSHVAAITGAAGAIGSVVAQSFADAGWRLATLDRPGHADAVGRRLPNALAVPVDLEDRRATDGAVQAVIDHYGRIDALLNLVGGFAMQSATDVTDEELERQLAVNLRTAFHATRAVLPEMLARGRGFVLGVAAASVTRGSARMPAYAAAKSAVAGYFRSVRAEVEPRGVGVSLLIPMGTVDTPANREAMPQADPASWIAREELAAAALFLAERGPRGRVRELMVFAG